MISAGTHTLETQCQWESLLISITTVPKIKTTYWGLYPTCVTIIFSLSTFKWFNGLLWPVFNRIWPIRVCEWTDESACCQKRGAVKGGGEDYTSLFSFSLTFHSSNPMDFCSFMDVVGGCVPGQRWPGSALSFMCVMKALCLNNPIRVVRLKPELLSETVASPARETWELSHQPG